MIEIRTYDNNKDANVVLQLAKSMHQESKYKSITFDEDVMKHFLSIGIDHLSTETFVAVHHIDGIVGFICLQSIPYIFNNARMASDIAVYVMPKYRASGVFVLLVDKAEQWCRAHHVHSMVFGITAPEDVARIERAYKKMGYKSWGTMVRKEFR